MRISYVADGASVHVRRWVAWFVARGHEVQLVTPPCDPLPGVHVVTVPFAKGFYFPRPRIAWAVWRSVRRFRPDVLHAHFIVGYGMYAALAWFHPFIVSAWGSDIGSQARDIPLVRRVARFVLRRADLIHVGDVESAARVRELGGREDRCLVSLWGVDASLFSPERRDPALRTDLAPPGAFLFFADRHLEAQVRHDVLVRAARELASRGVDVRTAIAGGGSRKEELQGMCDDPALGGRVRLLGKVPPEEMPRHYASADAYVDCFSAQVAGHGASLSLVEAMACGVPVIAARRPGLERLVEDGRTGYLFAPDDSTDLARTMATLAADPVAARAMGAAALRKAQEVADRDRNLHGIEERMNALVASRRR